MFNNNKIKRNWRSSDVKKFLTFTANTAGSTVKLTSFHEDSVVYNNSTRTVPVECKCPYLLSLEYSTNGINWQAYNFSEVYDENDNLIGYDGQVITLPRVGDFLIIRATRSNNNFNPNRGWCNWFTDVDPAYLPPTGWYQFVLSGSVAASGNLQSLIYKNLNSNTGIGQFYRLFKNCTQLTTAPYLGATILRKQMYRETFMGCTNIEEVESAPNLQNGGGARCDFVSMFEGCTSLRRFTNIHVTKGFNSSYGGDDFYRMFFGCTSLEEVPLYDTTLNDVQDGAYISTFEGCTSLTDASEYRMYPPHTPVYHSGERTFSGCTSLKYPPYINKYTLNIGNGNGTEGFKFAGCSSLKEIVYVSDTLPRNSNSSRSFTPYWVDGVSANGNFFLHKNCPKVYSKSFIPYGWNIEEIDNRPLCFEAVDAGSRIMFGLYNPTNPVFDEQEYEYSTNGTTWASYPLDTIITLENVGDKVYFRNKRRDPNFKAIGNYQYQRYRFNVPSSGSHRMKCSGNLYSLARMGGVWNNKGIRVGTIDNYYAFYGLFAACRGMITELPTFPDYNMAIQPQQFGFLFGSSIRNIDEVEIKYKKSKLLWNSFNRAFAGSATNPTSIKTIKVKTRDSNMEIRCLTEAFSYSPNIDRIEVFFTQWTDNDSMYMGEEVHYKTRNWLSNSCKQTGVLIHPKGLRTDIHNDSTFPEGWTTRTWEEEICSKYPNTVANMVQQYQGLGDIIDTYPNIGEILNQYPNLVHSLVNTGYKPYMDMNCDVWHTDVYPHQEMYMEFSYNRGSADDNFFAFSRASISQGWFSAYFMSRYVRIAFGDVTVGDNQTTCGDLGSHIIEVSKDFIKFDGTSISDTNCIKRGSFDTVNSNSVLYNLPFYFGGSITCSSKLYHIKLKEYGNLTHHYVPIADRVIADIADLDNIKILEATLASDDPAYASNTSVFGLEQI